jgi:SAM-dependent methyltransferase
MKEPDQHFYEHFASDRVTGLGARLARMGQERVFRFAEIGPDMRVLEIGPGRGAFAERCIKAGASYVAVEANADMAEGLRRRGCEVIMGLVPPLPALPAPFDRVVLSEVLEHMPTYEAALELASQIRDVLAEDGRIVVSVPDYLNWQSHFYIEDFTHSYPVTFRRLRGLLLSAGFTSPTGTYRALGLTGAGAVVLAGLARVLPFGWLASLMPKNRVFYKLRKLQTTLLRRVLMSAVKQKIDQPL